MAVSTSPLALITMAGACSWCRGFLAASPLPSGDVRHELTVLNGYMYGLANQDVDPFWEARLRARIDGIIVKLAEFVPTEPELVNRIENAAMILLGDPSYTEARNA